MINIKVLASSSRGNCYYVTDGVTPLLLECGISWKEIQRGLDFQTSDIQGCLISHEHGDHCKAVRDVLKAGIEVYASRGTFVTINVSSHKTIFAFDRKPFKIGTWTILPFEVQHDAEEPLGYLLVNKQGEKLLFITDSYYCKYRFKGLTHIMLEANHSYAILDRNVENGSLHPDMRRRLIQSHFSLENVKKFLQANDLRQVQEIHLIHLSENNSDAEFFKAEVQRLTGKPTYIARS